MASANNFFNLYLKVNDKEAEATLNNVGKDLSKLRAYTKSLEEGTEKWHAANKKLAEVETTYDGMKKRQRDYINQTKEATNVTDDQVSAMGEFGSSASEAFQALKSGDLIGFRTAMLGVTAGLKSAAAAAWKLALSPIGIGIAAIAGIALAAKAWLDYNKAAAEANLVTQQLTQLSGDALDNARVRAQSLQKTFGTEFKESLTVAKSLVKAFGISYDEAFDTIADGMIRGGAANDEFLKSFKEYPKLFAQAGFTVKDFQRIVNTGIDLGVYDDKLPDAIKEFSLSVMEQTASSRTALENAFGKSFTDTLFKGIEAGSVTVKEALILVAEEAENIGLNAQSAQQLTADLFRGAGEDAGGALLIFEAVTKSLIEQERALTPLEEQLKRVKDANDELAIAQNGALKSDKYAAFANELEVTWIKAKADFFGFIDWMSGGLIIADTAMRKFVFQSVQYLKDAFTIGADADWLKLGEQFDAIENKKLNAAKNIQKEKRANQEKEKEKTDPKYIAEQEADKKRRDEEEKTAAEAAKLKEARTKSAIAEEKKRLDSIDKLEEEYAKKAEDRIANSEVKKAELEQQRALEKAKALGASKDILDTIEAEHKLKIDEAKLGEEETELQKMREFEAKKLELENELRLARATSDAEREEIQKEIDLEKEELAYEKKLEDFEKEMEFLKLTDEEKNNLEQLLKQNHEDRIAEIEKKSHDERLAEEKKFKDELLRAEENLQSAKNQIYNVGIGALKQFFGDSKGIYLALLALEKGLAINEIIVNASTGIAAAQANLALVPPVIGVLPNPLYPVAAAIAAKNILATKLSAAAQIASVAGTALSGFDKGGYTDLFGMGVKDGSGHEVAGVVHTNEYVVPEIVRKDPEVPQILNYLEGKRKKALGLYADGGDTLENNSTGNPMSSGSSDINNLLIGMIGRLISKLDEPIVVDNYFGFEAEEKRQKTQRTLEKLKQKTQIKS